MPDPRALVDQPHARAGKVLERRLDVIDPVGDVVQSRSPAVEELPHRRVGSERAQQLHVAVADIEQHGLDALLTDRLAVDQRHPQAVAIERDRRLEIIDGDADVVDGAQHGAGG